jgi:hypothetical protein
MEGSHNDISVLHISLFSSRLMKGNVTMVNYDINGHHYDKGYYLANGMYPPWTIFFKIIKRI